MSLLKPLRALKASLSKPKALVKNPYKPYQASHNNIKNLKNPINLIQPGFNNIFVCWVRIEHLPNYYYFNLRGGGGLLIKAEH